MNRLDRLNVGRVLLVMGAALVVPVLTNGCSSNTITDAMPVCCKEYEAGSDMSQVDFHVEASIAGQLRAYAQAAGDVTVTAGAALRDATSACRQMAIDLGADPNDAGVKGKAGADLMNFWCDKAVANIQGTFTATGIAKGQLTITTTPAECSVSITAQANCQASCDVTGMCDIKANPPKCTGGTLDIDCKGDCNVSATAPTIDCTGQCTGMCSGSCTAQGPAVDCQGRCDGQCMAGGSSNGSGIQADGSCKGVCQGTCTMDPKASVSCSGTCSGQCSAACKATPGQASVKCSGTCTADYTPLSCTGGKLEGGCNVDAKCQANCNASASAKAQCTPPTLSISVSGTPKAGTEGQLAALVSTLKVNVPSLYVIAKVRGQAFADQISAVVDGGATLAASGRLDTHGGACMVLMSADVTQSVTDFGAALSASGKITAAVNM